LTTPTSPRSKGEIESGKETIRIDERGSAAGAGNPGSEDQLGGDELIFAELFSSEVKVDLLVLFHQNPGIADSAEGVARRIGRSGKDIESDLDDFVKLGILRMRNTKNGTGIIQLDRSKDEEMQKALDGYFEKLGGL
jgi:hypothetical protein